jgi:hypothetical protein
MLTQSKSKLHKPSRDSTAVCTGQPNTADMNEIKHFFMFSKIMLFLVEWKCLGPISVFVADFLSTGRASAIMVMYAIVTPYITLEILKRIIFWDMTPCSSLSFNRRFGGTYRLHLQGRRNMFSKPANKLATCLLAGLLNLFLLP